MKQRNARTPSQSSSLEAAIELNRLVLKQHQELFDKLSATAQAPQDQRPGWWSTAKARLRSLFKRGLAAEQAKEAQHEKQA